MNLPLLEKEASIEKVFTVLTARNHVWIVAEKGSKKLAGIITESDVLRSLAPLRLPKYVFGKQHGISFQHGTVIRRLKILCISGCITVHLMITLGKFYLGWSIPS